MNVEVLNHALLKKIFLFLFLLFFYSASTQTDSENTRNVDEWLSSSGEKGFEENNGQMTDAEGNAVSYVLFKTESPGMNFWITETGLVLQTFRLEEKDEESEDLFYIKENEIEYKKDENVIIKWERIDIELKGARIRKENISREYSSESSTNYFYPICAKGIYGSKEYRKLTIKDVYPYIDWVFYRKEDGTLKYDFVIHPGGDYKHIELIYKSKTPIKINEQGELVQYTAYGNIKENAPVSFYKEKKIETHFIRQSQKNIFINEDPGYETAIKFILLTSHVSDLTSDLIIDPQLTWATFFGGNLADGPKSIETDLLGNVYAIWYSLSTTIPSLNPGAGSYFQGVTGASQDVVIAKFNNSGVHLWTTFFGGGGSDSPGSIAIDNNNNVYIVGSTYSTNLPVQFLAGAFNAGTAIGGGDGFILKFNSSSVLLWGTYFGGTLIDGCGAVTTDVSGNIFVTGTTGSTNASFPLSTWGGAFYQGTSGGSGDVFVARFTSAGVLQWSTFYGGSSGENGQTIDVDALGNIYVAGYTSSTNFPVLSAFQGAKSGNLDGFLIKFNNTGVRQWATYYGGSDDEDNFSVAADKNGNVFLLGYTESSNLPVLNASGGAYYQGTYGGGTGGAIGGGDAFIVKFNGAGVRQWATYYGGSLGEHLQSNDNIAIDDCDNLYISLDTKSTDITLKALSCSYNDNSHNGGGTDQFIVRFSNGGVLQWASYFGGSGADFRTPIALDTSGSLFISGEWASGSSSTYPLNNPGGGAYYDTSPNGQEDAVMAKFVYIPFSFGTSTVNSGCTCTGVATVTATCTLLQYTWYNSSWSVVGTTSSISNLCAGSYTVEIKDTNNCKADTGYVTVSGGTSGAINVTQNINLCAGGTYTLPGGAIVTVSGTYKDTLASSLGCDSIITTNLAIGSPIITAASLSICNGQSMFIHGVSQNTAGIYTQTYTAAGGCDSISSITLNVNNISTYTITPSSCTSYTLNSQVYSSTGLYTQTLTNALGCDSLLTINLTISPTINTNSNQTICSWQTAVIHGVSQNTSGVYTQTFIAATGCDSISSVTLTVNSLSTYTINPSSCSSYTVNGQVYSTTGVYTQTLINSLGCDSLLTISLTISPIINTNNNQTICSGQAAVIHGISQNSPGIYTQTFTASTGCDSISTITLTVIPTPTLSITPLIDTINKGGSITLTAMGGTAYSWSNGSTESIIIVSPTQNTSYCVIGTNGITCADTACSDVLVVTTTCDSVKIFIPTGFSPNGDGQNDELRLFSNTKPESMYFALYNRWGQVVFETTDLAKTWDGLFNNQPLDAAVFTYTLKYSCKNTIEEIVLSGNITLIR